MNNPFTFSIRDAVRTSWQLFKTHPWFFVGLTLCTVLLNIIPEDWLGGNIVVIILLAILSVILSYVWLSVSLAAVDHKTELLSFKTIQQHLPTLQNFFMLIIIGIVTGFLVVCGFVLLIIPGIIVLTKLAFTNLAYVDRKGSVGDILKYSWNLVTKDVFWTVLLALVVALGLFIVGVLFLGVGFFVTYPIAMLMLAQLYRTLTRRAAEIQTIVEQPIEIPATV